MKNLLLLSLLILLSFKTFGQTKTDTPKIVHKTYKDYDDLQKQRETLKSRSMYAVDTVLGFKAISPPWFKIRETGSDWLFGGTLPDVDGIENVIMIKAWPKKDYADTAAFRDFVIGSCKLGIHPKWGPDHVCYGVKEMGPVPGIGKSYKAFDFWQLHLYACMYVLAETKTTWLWIEFVATQTTYDTNLPKFQEFLKGMELL